MAKGTGILRIQNQKKILSYIRKNKQTSRNDLAKELGVSKNTISLIVDEYIKEGIIREVGSKDIQKVGRPKIVIELNNTKFKAVGVTIHHDLIEYVLCDYHLNVIEQGNQSITDLNPLSIVNKIQKIVSKLSGEYSGILGVGVGVPGVVNSKEGIINVSTKLKWEDVHLQSLLRESISIPIHIQNSVKMASLCAIHSEVDLHIGSAFYMRIGNGVGGAFILRGEIWNGDSWTAGEIGHISVDSDGPVCDCGQRGCLEKIIGIKAYNKWLNSIGLSGKNKEELVLNKMEKYGRFVGIALTNTIHLLNPGKIFIDSPYNINEQFRKSVTAYINKSALKLSYSDHIVRFNESPYPIGLGAALSVILHFESSAE